MSIWLKTIYDDISNIFSWVISREEFTCQLEPMKNWNSVEKKSCERFLRIWIEKLERVWKRKAKKGMRAWPKPESMDQNPWGPCYQCSDFPVGSTRTAFAGRITAGTALSRCSLQLYFSFSKRVTHNYVTNFIYFRMKINETILKSE